MLRETLSRICLEFPTAKTQPIRNHAFARFLRSEAPYNVATSIKSTGQYGHLSGSGPKFPGNWGDVVWLSLIDERIGNDLVVVYLFSTDLRRIYLTIALKVEGHSNAEVLRRREALREHCANGEFRAGPLQRGTLGNYGLPQRYESAVVSYLEYDPTNLPQEDALLRDLRSACAILDRIQANKIFETLNQKSTFVINKKAFAFSPEDVRRAFAATPDGYVGKVPDWYVTVDGHQKPAKAVFSHMPGFDRNLVFTSNHAVSAFERLGFKCTRNRTTKGIDGPLVLIGTSRYALEYMPGVIEQIKTKGAWASWWSFPIKPSALDKLKPPFHLYISVKGRGIVFRHTVSEMETRGAPFESPWPEITDAQHIGKKRAGAKRSQVFKTWLRVTKCEPVKLSIDDFTPAKPWSKLTSLRNQSTFGYAYLADGPRAMPAAASHAGASTFTPDAEVQRILKAFRNKKNLILQGPPGVGKTFIAKKLAYELMGEIAQDRLAMVQFHQSFAYEDFMQGYRPTDDGKFVLKNGLFYEFCRKAMNDPRDHVFIIDEINRGNLSRIFGEVMLLVEKDKRGPDHAIPLTYSRTSADTFHIPENVYVLGLMNTADRSLAMVDYALRRRFAFHSLEPMFHTDAFERHLRSAGASDAIINRIRTRVAELNEQIEKDPDLGTGFKVGHSYFCAKPDSGVYDEAWYRHIIDFEVAPLVREYWSEKPRIEQDAVLSRLSDG